MLIDTKQIITKTQLRENLAEALVLVKKGKELIISDRGKIIARVCPINRKDKVEDVSNFMVEVDKLRRKLSCQNPNFDSLKALREVREEN